MAAAQEFLVDAFVAGATVARRHVRRDHEAVVVLALLLVRGLMAIETVHALFGVSAHLVLVDDGVLLPDVALGAFAGSPHQALCRLLSLNRWPRPIDQERGDDDGKSKYYGYEYGTERHRIVSHQHASRLSYSIASTNVPV